MSEAPTRPRIGVTAKTGVVPAEYLTALEEAGADAVVLANDPAHAAADAAAFDAILLTGGADVDPARYGAPAHQATIVADAERDEYEIALVHAARARDIPMLAVCRGLQVVNVALGGTLAQHIPDVVGEAIRHRVMDEPGTVDGHDVEVEPNSALAKILGTARFATTSRHHQAADIIAQGLACTAWTEDGVVEALEAPDARFLIAVQWHPEAMLEVGATSARLFRAFVESAAAARLQR